jgi:hypothetical protein
MIDSEEAKRPKNLALGELREESFALLRTASRDPSPDKSGSGDK